MTSPFVRRRRLAAELRKLREERGLTADELARRLHQSRMKISKLENAHIRPDLADVMKILDTLDVTGAKWTDLVHIARDAAERGWWDMYGDSMGQRQRIYADIESGAKTIREYVLGVMAGVLQLPEYTWNLIELMEAEGPLNFVPEKSVAARAQRRETILRPDGPEYEVILDEVGLRRFTVGPEVMAAQLRHVIELVETYPRLTVRVFPLVTGMVTTRLPRSDLVLYTFHDPADPAMAVGATDADLFHIEPDEVARHIRRYEYVRDASLSPVSSLTFLNDLAGEIADAAGSGT
jgi:transcriptional regulator with XRE-family HTH domain